MLYRAGRRPMAPRIDALTGVARPPKVGYAGVPYAGTKRRRAWSLAGRGLVIGTGVLAILALTFFGATLRGANESWGPLGADRAPQGSGGWSVPEEGTPLPEVGMAAPEAGQVEGVEAAAAPAAAAAATEDDDDDDLGLAEARRAAKLLAGPLLSEEEGGDPLVPLLREPEAAARRLAECDPEWEWADSSDPVTLCLATSMRFIKASKAASSTTAGIVSRISSRWGVSRFPRGEPFFVDRHKNQRQVAQFLKWRAARRSVGLPVPVLDIAMARHPVHRCLSYWGHEKRRVKLNDTEEVLLDFIKTSCSNFIWDYLDMDARSDGSQEEGPLGFLGVVERFDESMLVLAWILGASIGDVLYVPSKDSRTRIRVHGHVLRLGPYKHFDQQSDLIRDALTSEAFNASNVGDYRLVAAANRWLDAQIERIGPGFAALYAEFTAHVRESQARCGGRVGTDGVKELADCIKSDNGCSRTCLDDYAHNFSLWEPVSLLEA